MCNSEATSEATSDLSLIENIVYNIRRVLTKDLVDSRYFDNLNKCKKTKETIFIKKSPLYGHSQHAVEALCYLLKNIISINLKPMYAMDMYKNGYWWTELNKVIIDCTYGCYMDIDQYPYDDGVKSEIELSKKGRIVVERVMEIEKEIIDNNRYISKFKIAKTIEIMQGL